MVQAIHPLWSQVEVFNTLDEIRASHNLMTELKSEADSLQTNILVFHYCSKIWFTYSDCPSVWEWKAVERCSSKSKGWKCSSEKWESNCGPWFDMMLEGNPWSFKTCSKKRAVTPVVGILWQGTKWDILDRRSLTVNIVVVVWELGSSTIKSIDMYSEGQEGVGRGLRVGNLRMATYLTSVDIRSHGCVQSEQPEISSKMIGLRWVMATVKELPGRIGLQAHMWSLNRSTPFLTDTSVGLSTGRHLFSHKLATW